MEELNLIFIISQPRSGSSLLQQLLINSREITSTPEPWILLPLFASIDNIDGFGYYNFRAGTINLRNFQQRFPDSLESLKKDLKYAALNVYKCAFAGNSKKYFLDKTPRYYHIIKDIVELFPNSRKLILTRNPLQVFSSILDYNCRGEIPNLGREDIQHDLLTAPRNIMELKKCNFDNCYFTQYEKIVLDSENELKGIFDFLEIDSTELRTEYQIGNEFLSTLSVDRKSLHKHLRPVSNYLNSWKQVIDSKEKKFLLKDYIQLLGEEYFEIMGYDYERTVTELDNHLVKWKPFELRFNELKGLDADLSISNTLTRLKLKLNNIL